MRQADKATIQARASQVLDTIDSVLATVGETDPAEVKMQSELIELKGRIAALTEKIGVLGVEVAQAKQVSGEVATLKAMVAHLQAELGKLSQGKDPLYRPPD